MRFLLLFTSLLFWGIPELPFLGSTLPLWNFVIIGGCLHFLPKINFKVVKSIFLILSAKLPLVIFSFFTIFHSPNFTHSVLTTIALALNLLFFWGVAQDYDLQKIRYSLDWLKKIYLLTSIPAILLYLCHIYYIPIDIGDFLIHRLDRGVNVRFTAFVGDPNFLALFSLFIIIFTDNIKKDSNFSSLTHLNFSNLTHLVAILSILLSESRTGLVLLIIYLFFKTNNKTKLILSIMALSLILLPILPDDIFDRILEKARFSNISNDSRVQNLWLPLLNAKHNFFIGNGFSSVKSIIPHYSHNTYLDIYFELGIIGLILYFTELFATSIIVWKSSNSNLLWMFLIYLLFLVNFSLLFNPFIILIQTIIIVVYKNTLARETSIFLERNKFVSNSVFSSD